MKPGRNTERRLGAVLLPEAELVQRLVKARRPAGKYQQQMENHPSGTASCQKTSVSRIGAYQLGRDWRISLVPTRRRIWWGSRRSRTTSPADRRSHVFDTNWRSVVRGQRVHSRTFDRRIFPGMYTTQSPPTSKVCTKKRTHESALGGISRLHHHHISGSRIIHHQQGVAPYSPGGQVQQQQAPPPIEVPSWNTPAL